VWTAEGVPSAGNGIVVSGNAIAVEDAIVPMYYAGAGAPTITCTTARDFYVDTAAGNLYFCKATGVWQLASDPNDTTSFRMIEEFPSSSVSGATVGTFSRNLAYCKLPFTALREKFSVDSMWLIGFSGRNST